MFERHGSGQPAFSGAPTISIGLREVLDAAPDIIFCCDQQGRFQWMSAAIDAVAGVRASDLLGSSFTRLVPLPYRNHLARRYLRRARNLKSDAHLDITRIQNAAGQEVWLAVRSRMSLRPDGELVFVGVARPMSEAEIALAMSELPAQPAAPALETAPEASVAVAPAPAVRPAVEAAPSLPLESSSKEPTATSPDSADAPARGWSLAVSKGPEAPAESSSAPNFPAPPAAEAPAAPAAPVVRPFDGLQIVPFEQFPPPDDIAGRASSPSPPVPPLKLVDASPESQLAPSAPNPAPAPESAPEPLSASFVAPIAPFEPPAAAPSVLPPAESNTQILAAIQSANEARAEAERRLAELREEHEAALRQVAVFESERDELRRERESLRGEMAEASHRRDEFERQLADTVSRREAAERELAELARARDAAERQSSEGRRRVEAAEREAFEWKHRHEQAERLSIEARQSRDASEAQLADVRRAREAAESQLGELRARAESAERRADEARARLEAAERQLGETQLRFAEVEQRAAAGADARTQNALQQLEALRQEHRRALDLARDEAARAVDAARLEGIRSLEAARLEGARALDEARFDASRAMEAARTEHARALEAVHEEHARALETARGEAARNADSTGAASLRELEASRAECARLQARLTEAERRCHELQAQFSNVDRRVQDAQYALTEAQAQAQLKGDFLATISHEIRTPMNGVMGMTHLLLETELDNEQRNLVEVIRNSSQTLIHLIDDTLDFSKLEAGRLEIEKLDFDLRVTVDEVSALLAPMANAKALDFDCQVSHEVPSRLKGDPGRIRQVLFNLGGNAIKFTEEGCVTVRVDRVSEDDARVTLKFSVTDTGGGESREELAHVFQSAASPDAAITRQYGGAGLGLAISRSLVTLMGGEVGVETAEGLGSSYWFRMALDKQAGPAYSAAPKNVQLRGMRVIVVDPSKNIRQSLKEMLSAWGCETDEADSADEALTRMRNAASEGRPHQVALIEMQLPGTNGEQLGWAIRSDAALERTITMMMTSVGRKGDAQRAQTMGFSAYLLKPIEWGELYDGLIEVVHAQQSQTPGNAPALVTRHSLAEARRGRMRILLVEDNAVNQLVANWALQRLGYTIDVANNANEALSRSETQRYDLILMDVQMPDMDGFKTTTAIRTRERGGLRTPIVAMTGNTQPSEIERCHAAGMDDCLPKPIDIGQLCSMVERWTRAHSNQAASAERSPVRASAITLKAPDLEKKLELMARGDAPAGEAKRSPGDTLDALPANLENSGIGFKPVVIDSEDAAAPEVPIDNARLEGSSMGIAALRDTLLNTFLADVPPRLERLAAAMIEHEAHRIEFEAHGLMGMCATVGAVACERVFAQIERLAAEERVTECTRLLPRAKAEVERTEAYISRLERILSRAA
ncbi:MAG TPA: response regulator [Candidatus Sulfotelmatobacter sp.]|nr:response regulator [Candidatus Sulfotelmatobacter sp.]